MSGRSMISFKNAFASCVKHLAWILSLAFYALLFNCPMMIALLIGSIAIGFWKSAMLIGLAELAFLFFVGRHLFRKINADSSQEESNAIMPTGYERARQCYLVAIAADILLFMLCWLIFGERLGASGLAALLFALPPLAGIILWRFKPKAHASTRMGTWVKLGIVKGCILLFVLFIAYSLAPRKIHYRSESFTPERYYSLTRFFVQLSLPPDAKNIEIDGDTGLVGLGFHVELSCDVPESSFLDFAKRNNYALKENDPCYNANPETNNDPDYQLDHSTRLPMKKLPDSFWFYNYCYRNYGGQTMLYDRKAQKLYGKYSSN